MRLTRILIDALSTTSMTRRAAGLKPCSLRLRRQQNGKLILYGLDATSVIAAAGERGLPLRTTYMFMHTPNAGSCRLNDQRRAKKSLNKLRPSSGRVLSQIKASVFLWNVFPLHPHEPGNPFSNRSHNACERRAGEEFLSELILLLKPCRLVAIGNDAAQSAQRLCGQPKVIRVRHPSHGGKTQFSAQMGELYDLGS